MYEKMLSRFGGKYIVSDDVTFAALCWFPMYMCARGQTGSLINFKEKEDERPLSKAIVKRLEDVGSFEQEVECVSMKKS